SISDLSGLNEASPAFIFSLTSLTGKLNYGSDCFAESIYKNPSGALGVIAASEITYAFVTDSYVWGLYDYLWPEFFPGVSSNPGYNGVMPAFANVAGKYYLYQDNWPFNPNSKEVTYHLFHNFGDVFSGLYTQMPQHLTVLHDSILASGQDYFTVTADSGALISLTVNNEIIGIHTATGIPTDIIIPPQASGDTMYVTVTKPNYYRYSRSVLIIDPNLIHEQTGIFPGDFQLFQNYPNPFNPSTTIEFYLPKPGDVTIKVYNALGEEVETIISQRVKAGFHRYRWTPRVGIASGIYWYWIKAEGFSDTKQMLYLK
ncbi:MAG: T9SS type A sorting domain-containing protein, partial [Calditrichia bacterium]